MSNQVRNARIFITISWSKGRHGFIVISPKPQWTFELRTGWKVRSNQPFNFWCSNFISFEYLSKRRKLLKIHCYASRTHACRSFLKLVFFTLVWIDCCYRQKSETHVALIYSTSSITSFEESIYWTKRLLRRYRSIRPRVYNGNIYMNIWHYINTS